MSEQYEPGLVSIVTPTYNRADILGDTIASVAAQAHRPIEMLIVDDGSTDDTEGVVQAWQDRIGQDAGLEIRLLRQGKRGAPAARNLGLIESRGQFIQFLDSDDLLGPEKLARQVEQLEDTGAGVASYGPKRAFRVVPDGIEVLRKKVVAEGDPIANWLRHDQPNCNSLFWQRQCVARLGPWREGLTASQDTDYLGRFLLAGGQYVYCENAWSYNRSKPPGQGITGTKRRTVVRSALRVFRTMERELARQGRLEEYRLLLGYMYYRGARLCLPIDLPLAAFCQRRMHCLGDRLVPGRTPRHVVRLLLGLRGERLAWRLFRLWSGFVRRGSSNPEYQCVATAEDIQAVIRFDMPGGSAEHGQM